MLTWAAPLNILWVVLIPPSENIVQCCIVVGVDVGAFSKGQAKP